jgi:pimeloyl-ACP methyl ester carboxylesterase
VAVQAVARDLPIGYFGASTGAAAALVAAAELGERVAAVGSDRAGLDSAWMRRNWIVAAVVIAIAAIVIAVLLVRLTGDDADSETVSWAGSVCQSVSDWRASISSLAEVQPGDLNAETLRGKIEDAEDATEDLVSELRALGAPDLESGGELQEQLETTADALRSDYDSLKSEAERVLESDSATSFLQALAALAPQFQRLLTGAATLIEELQRLPGIADDERSELRRAFDEAPECRELRGEE